MNIGNLYLVKKYFWLLYPTKETVTATSRSPRWPFSAGEPYAATPIAAAASAAWYSKRFNCEVTYFCLDSIVVFLEEDGFLKKVLTSDGKIGWTWFNEYYNDCFEILDFEKIEK